MAKAVINLQKESGGIVKISSVDGTGITEVTVPESGNLVSVDTAVTDNAVVRFDGTTGQVQNSSVTIDDNGTLGIGNTSDNNTRRLGFTTASGGSSAIESVTIGSTDQALVFKTTYVTESEKMRLTGLGSLLLTSGTGALGYGTGAGGTVTQLTYKNFNVSLNKPTGTIITSNSVLLSGQGTSFIFLNSLLSINDNLNLTPKGTINYDIDVIDIYNGAAVIRIINKDSISHSDAISINFSVEKGANS